MSNFGDIELINTINELTLRLNKAVTFMKDCGVTAAEKEKAYKIALRQEALRLRAEGMAVGLIDKVAPGGVAEERFERDAADAYYKAAQENVLVLKLQIRILDNQISREWGANG